MPDVLVVDLNPHEIECYFCDAPTVVAQGIPTYEGEAVPVDYEGDWCGHHACRRCFDAYTAGGPAALQARLDALSERNLYSKQDRQMSDEKMTLEEIDALPGTYRIAMPKDGDVFIPMKTVERLRATARAGLTLRGDTSNG